MNKIPIIVILLALVLLIGCVSIPKEAPELSAELGNRISAIEDANLKLLHQYFKMKKKEIDEFIATEWTPVFAKNFFNNPPIADEWNTIVRDSSKTNRLKFIVMLGPMLQEEINRKRLELIQPLEEIEKTIELKLREEYHQTRAINNTITSFLYSASKVVENRQKYLDMVGISDKSVGLAIDKTDEVVLELVTKAGNVEKKTDDVIEKLKKIKKTLSK